MEEGDDGPRQQRAVRERRDRPAVAAAAAPAGSGGCGRISICEANRAAQGEKGGLPLGLSP